MGKDHNSGSVSGEDVLENSRATLPLRHPEKRGVIPLNLSRLAIGISLASLFLIWITYRAFVWDLNYPLLPNKFLESFVPPSTWNGPTNNVLNTHLGLTPNRLVARGGTSGTCRMSWSTPSYIPLSPQPFSSNFTRFSNKYSLFLYREDGWDPIPDGFKPSRNPGSDNTEPQQPQLDMSRVGGTPVLFVPGNAGSYKQVRSFASGGSRLFWERPGVPRRENDDRVVKGLDWFTIDFNEDFSAFHAVTLTEQAEYLNDAIRFILSLYQSPSNHGGGGDHARPNPTSVLIVSHSMGGISARLALTLDNYNPGSVNTILTLASPHAAPPIATDSAWGEVYDRIALERFESRSHGSGRQHDGHSVGEEEREEKDLVIVSIAGGKADTMINSDAALLPFPSPPASKIDSEIIQRNSNHGHVFGFTVFTTTIPGVYTSIDHLAILWCDQLRTVVIEALLDIIDVRRKEQVIGGGGYLRKERLKKWMVGGIGEEQEGKEVDWIDGDPLDVDLDSRDWNIVKGPRVRQDFRGSGDDVKTFGHLFPIPHDVADIGLVFNLLTDAPLGIDIRLCILNKGSEDRDMLNQNTTPMKCRQSPRTMNDSHLIARLPKSPLDGVKAGTFEDEVVPLPPGPSENGHLSFVQLSAIDLAHGAGGFLIISSPKDLGGSHNAGWLIGEMVHDVKTHIERVGLSPLTITSIPSSAALVSKVQLLGLDNSLLTFKLIASQSSCHRQASLFSPFLRQHTLAPTVFESSYHPNINSVILHAHSVERPYLLHIPASDQYGSLHLQLFMDPECAGIDDGLNLTVSLNWGATLARIALRYRVAVISIPFALVAFCLGLQFQQLNKDGNFPSFGIAFSQLVRRHLLKLQAAVFLLCVLQSVVGSPSDVLQNCVGDALAGNQDLRLVGLFPFLIFLGVGIVTVEHVVLQSLISLVALSFMAFEKLFSRRTSHTGLETNPHETTTSKQRILSIGVILLLVIFFAPYQFAFLVIFLVQVSSTAETLVQVWKNENTSSRISKDLLGRYHSLYSILFLFFSLLPINATVLLVWVRNLAAGWYAPFSSDHNVFRIAGFLLLTEALQAGGTVTIMRNRIDCILFMALGGFSLLYGIRFTHILYSLSNWVMLWLAYQAMKMRGHKFTS